MIASFLLSVIADQALRDSSISLAVSAVAFTSSGEWKVGTTAFIAAVIEAAPIIIIGATDELKDKDPGERLAQGLNDGYRYEHYTHEAEGDRRIKAPDMVARQIKRHVYKPFYHHAGKANGHRCTACDIEISAAQIVDKYYDG